mmetsp:Transcript_98118/g.245971  ORF Transcript_98118/g.245971 Transcript_98118/m.245971 type:complete len:674 (+) Transcript_98118:73-2094(+)
MAPRRKLRARPGGKGKKNAAQAAAAKAQRERNRDASSGSGSGSGSDSCSQTSEEDSSSSGGSDEDDPREYKHGGYHPVSPYQIYSARYRVLSKLGAGAFSTVWLCADEKDAGPDGPQLVAMKVCKSKRSVTEQALDEIDLLERLDNNRRGSPHVVQMCGHFWHSGPNGRHKCMVFEVMGENLLALVKHYDYNGLPMAMCKRLARHTLLGLSYIHSRGVIHTDVKLENVLVQRHDLGELLKEARRAHRAYMDTRAGMEGLSKSQKKRMKKKEKAKAKTKDEEGAEVDDEASKQSTVAEGSAAVPEESVPVSTDGADPDEAAAQACGRPIPPVRQRERFDTLEIEQVFAKLADFGNGCRSNRKVTDDIQTRQYRSPEVIIGQGWDETADNWSAACMFFELLTGDFLFDPHTGDDWSRDEDHLALMIELLGDNPPKDWATGGKYSRDFFTNGGKLKHIKNLKMWPLSAVLAEKYSLEQEAADEVTDFLAPMLTWLPSKRQQAFEALKHPWVQAHPGEVDMPPQISFAPHPRVPTTDGGKGEVQTAKKAESATPPPATIDTADTGLDCREEAAQGEMPVPVPLGSPETAPGVAPEGASEAVPEAAPDAAPAASPSVTQACNEQPAEPAEPDTKGSTIQDAASKDVEKDDASEGALENVEAVGEGKKKKNNRKKKGKK